MVKCLSPHSFVLLFLLFVVTQLDAHGIFDEMRTWRAHHRFRRLVEKCEFCCEANIRPGAFVRRNLCRSECPAVARINLAKFESGDPFIELCPPMVRGIGGDGIGGGGIGGGGIGGGGIDGIGNGGIGGGIDDGFGHGHRHRIGDGFGHGHRHRIGDGFGGPPAAADDVSSPAEGANLHQPLSTS